MAKVDKNSSVPEVETAEEEMHKRFIQLPDDRPLYNTELCQSKPVVGFLLGLVDLAKEGERPFECFIVRLTEDTIATTRKREVLPVKKGQEIHLPVTYHLEKFKRLLENREDVAEIYVKPKEKFAIGGGQTLWSYQIGISAVKHKRSQIAPETALFAYAEQAQAQRVLAERNNSEPTFP